MSIPEGFLVSEYVANYMAIAMPFIGLAVLFLAYRCIKRALAN